MEDLLRLTQIKDFFRLWKDIVKFIRNKLTFMAVLVKYREIGSKNQGLHW
jgi:hypothetical protein